MNKTYSFMKRPSKVTDEFMNLAFFSKRSVPQNADSSHPKDDRIFVAKIIARLF
jgi:hypothetical protein